MEEEQKSKDKYGCQLVINTRDDHPSVVTDITGLDFSKIVIKGSNKLRPVTKEIIEGKYYDYNLWVYDVQKKDVSEGYYLNEVFEEMLDSMDAKKESLLSIFKKYPTNHISCYAYFYDFNPYFKFDKELVSRLSDYKIDIQFDIYFLPE